MEHSPTGTTADLDDLASLFYDSTKTLGSFEAVDEAATPEPYRGLLAHDHHMTVSVERWHESPVDVHVLETGSDDQFYWRKILLSRQRDGAIVQFGIVRLNFFFLDAETRREVEARKTPLGRVLIQHNVLRQVQLVGIWRVTPGPELCDLFNLSQPSTTFGRTALIHCNGEPAVELLEIVTPT